MIRMAEKVLAVHRGFASLAVLLALLPLTAAGQEDVCQFPAVDAFLDKCPTNDPALKRILSDFTSP